ncbi:High-affinity branched-chain amino acid transport ATP-binding protein LivF [Methylobacterium crusticola]|uniref:High-affinity branched-chain amino acid transport ATP-binding protein LivF n=1 Tax=Methylobacterium crusticola TaxID=1697972 RepID=A0ABQ4RAA8_9HYPH|nr:ABC transporter ATP-binding protein [Methylobacterium crusticola]GJD53719.1 High-affinity branched-chain amino acid transport ATP-binding protein LivF [Methylobacterium crusticola]
MSRDAVLELAAVSSGYGAAIVVRGIDLAIGRGEIVALLGKNGMGKTTLLRTIMGYLRPAEGAIRLEGRAIAGLSPHRIARRAVAYAPQEAAIFQDLSVGENLRLALRRGGVYAEELTRVTEAFPFLRERGGQRAGSLSGGEQKMLLVARALMARPRIMLLDEITEGLQPSVIRRLAAVLRAERQDSGTAMLLVEQNVAFAREVADRYAVLRRGEIVDAGPVGAADAEGRIEAGLRI